MSTPRLRTLSGLARRARFPLPLPTRTITTTARAQDAVPKTQDKSEPPVPLNQAPNRAEVWAPSQKPRKDAMVGPRFEQTDFYIQPQPHSAMELVHKQPVRWTHDRVVACDGGGGPTGHPRIFINVDKPEIATCNYCGLPFANEHNREHLEALPETSYPLA